MEHGEGGKGTWAGDREKGKDGNRHGRGATAEKGGEGNEEGPERVDKEIWKVEVAGDKRK